VIYYQYKISELMLTRRATASV